MFIKAIGAFSPLNFGKKIDIKDIKPDIIRQLPVKGQFIVYAEETSADTLEITQGDSTTFVTKFVDGKKVLQKDSYNGHLALVTEFDRQTGKAKAMTYYDADGNITKQEEGDGITTNI